MNFCLQVTLSVFNNECIAPLVFYMMCAKLKDRAFYFFSRAKIGGFGKNLSPYLLTYWRASRRYADGSGMVSGDAKSRPRWFFFCTGDPVISGCTWFCSYDKTNGIFHTSNRCAVLPFCLDRNALTVQQWRTFVFITTDKMHDYHCKGIKD